MEDNIKAQEVKTVNDLLKEQQDLIKKIGEDSKTIENINEQIAAFKKLRAEMKANSDVSESALNKNLNAIQKLRNERTKATANMLEFFKTFTTQSEKAMEQLTKLYEYASGEETRRKSNLERERASLKALVAKYDEEDKKQQQNETTKGPVGITDEQAYKIEKEKNRQRLKEVELEMVQVDREIKDREHIKKKYESVVKITNASADAMKNIVEGLMKYTNLPTKTKDEGLGKKPEKKDASKGGDAGKSENTEKIEGSDATDTLSSTVTDSASSTTTGSDVATDPDATMGTDNASEDDTLTEDEKTENIKLNHEARLQSAIEYAEAATAVVNEMNNIWDAIDERRMQKKQEQYDKDVLLLDEQLANGTIQQEEYNAKVLELDKNLSKEKAKIEREQAIRKKATSIFQVTMDTAAAIMKAWVEAPLWGSIVFTAAIAAMGAAQIAAILATPLPKARKGGLIVGNSHENGGVIIEAEGGEAILTKKAVRAFPGMVALMNAAAANGSIQDGGYAARSIIGFGDGYASDFRNGLNEIDYNKLSRSIADNLKDVKIYLAVTDLNDGLKQYVQIEDMARI